MKVISKSFIRYILLLLTFFLIVPAIQSFAQDTLHDQHTGPINLKVGFTIYKPATFINKGGEEVGIYIDILNYIAQQENWEFQYIVGNWNDLLMQTYNGDIDILLNMAVTEERKKHVLFTSESIFNSWAEILVSEDSDIRSIPDLEGKRISTLYGSNYTVSDQGIIKIIENFQLNSEIITFEGGNEVIQALLDGQVDAAVTGRLRAQNATNEFGLKRSSIVFLPVPIHFGISKDHPFAQIIAETIDRYLVQLKRNPESEYYKTYDRYFTAHGPVLVQLPDWFNWIAFGGIFLLSLFIFNVFFLRWQVRKRTASLKSANDNLTKSKTQYKDLVEKANVAVTLADIEGNLIYSNENYAFLLGYSVEELLAIKLRDLVHPEDIDIVEKNHKNRIYGDNIPKYEFRGIKKDGSIVWMEVDGAPIEENGKIIGVRNYFWDITERKRADDALNTEQDFSKSIIDASPAFFVAINNDGTISMISKSMLDALGYEIEEVIDKDYVSIFIPEEDRDELNIVFEKLVQSEMNTYNVNRVLAKNGSELLVEWYGKSVFNNENTFEYFFGIGLDITEKNKAEEEKTKLQDQLFQSQKMESIGRLAGGIAHDFNNILTGIIGYSELLKVRIGNDPSPDSEAISIILESSERAANLTKQLLGFARKGKYKPVPLNLNAVLKQVLKVLDKIFEKNIKVIEDFGEISNVFADDNQMDQVFTNILINAKDAMPDGGDLYITTNEIYLDHDFITSIPELDPGNYILTSITDTGSGMSKEIKVQIFEPFFTTKGEGEGTGLGLATVYGIIKNHSGNLTVYSEPGEGTTFNVYLPITYESITEKNVETYIVKGDAVILVIDDEKNIRDISKNRLEEVGYTVLLAEDGNDGLEIYKKNKEKIDIILLDMIMPNLSGKETYISLKELNPDVKVIIMSGFSKTGKVEEVLYEGAVGYIQKPFRIQELSKTIDDILK